MKTKGPASLTEKEPKEYGTSLLGVAEAIKPLLEVIPQILVGVVIRVLAAWLCPSRDGGYESAKEVSRLARNADQAVLTQ